MTQNYTEIELDEFDHRIIEALRAAPQSSNADLARKLRVAKTTIGLRVGRLISAGVLRIMGATNPAKVGYSLSAWVLFQCRGRKLADIAADISKIPEAIAVGSLRGNYALYAVLMARDTSHLEKLLEIKLGAIRGIIRTNTHLVLDTLKYRVDFKTIRLADGGVQARLREIELSDLMDTHDDLDRHLLAEFQNDGRVTYRELARRYKIPESTVRVRSRRLQNKGEIVYLAATDPALMGLQFGAFIYIRASLAHVRSIAQELAGKEYANAVLITLGASDILCVGLFRTQEEISSVVHESIPTLEGVASVEVMQTNNVYKQLLGWARVIDSGHETSLSQPAGTRNSRKRKKA